MEGWRQERLGSRAGTHREEEKNKNILTRNEKRERKTYLTLTGPLMEGVEPSKGHRMRLLGFPILLFDNNATLVPSIAALSPGVLALSSGV